MSAALQLPLLWQAINSQRVARISRRPLRIQPPEVEPPSNPPEKEPRIGLAYRLDEKMVIRMGYGISSDPYYFTNMRDAYPAVISQQYAGANSYMAAGSLATGIPALVGPVISQGSFPLPTNVGTLTFPKDFNRGYIESYNFTVQRNMGLGFNAQVSSS